VKFLIASDHAGFDLKQSLKAEFPQIEWIDLGTHSKESVDYPDFATNLCQSLPTLASYGVLICGSGQGMAIKANRYKHIRAALCWTPEVAEVARAHNDANVLCLGSRFIDLANAKEILLRFSQTPFEGGRHQQRVNKLC